jgi:hypothetical protein
MKAEVRAGKREPRAAYAAALADPDFAAMKVFDLLMAMPKQGRVKANRMLVRARVAPSKTFAGLTERQRRELAAMLPR